MTLGQLTPTQVERWLWELAEWDLAPRTLQYADALPRRILHHAVGDDLVTRNVTTIARPHAVPQPATTA